MATVKEKKIIYDNKEHLKELVKELVTLHKNDGYENFEEISMFVREKNTKLDTFQYRLPSKAIKKCFQHTPLEEKILTDFSLNKKHIAKTIPNYMEDVFHHSKLFEWGGVSFSEEEWYKIRMAMKKILLENDCEYLRFFGKIYGINSDYYIIQGSLKTYPMKNPQVHVETRGNEGINRYTFWVSNSILESWYELPDITHEQIVISRRFKYHLTGDLNAKVKSFVSFPGKEMHLLKCQIIRILHSSCIVPKGYYKISENFKEQLEGKVTEIDEEYKSPSFEEMKGPEGESWVHEHAYIYPNGKVIDPSVETQVDRLKGINEDEGYKVKEGEGENVNEIDLKYWKVKVVGDQIMHNRANGDPITHAVVLVKNLRWPGTLTVWKEEKFANIYVGYGIKAIGENYYPTQLIKVDKDPSDLEEQKEPYPEKEPPKPEEKKEGEEEGEKEENKEGGEEE
jgi:radial spoke head protein 4A